MHGAPAMRSRGLTRLPVFPLLCSLASCGGGSSANDVQVMSFSPTGAVDGDATITIRFDRPVVDEPRIAGAVEPELVVVSPAVPWRGFWQDQRTLVVDPTAPLASSTRYRVALGGELGRRTAGLAFDFVSDPIAVEGVAGVDPKMVALAASGDPATPGGPATTVALRPVAPLKPGGSYTLTCSALAGAGGVVPLAAPYTLPRRARPPLAIVHVSPDGRAIGADEVEIT